MLFILGCKSKDIIWIHKWLKQNIFTRIFSFFPHISFLYFDVMLPVFYLSLLLDISALVFSIIKLKNISNFLKFWVVILIINIISFYFYRKFLPKEIDIDTGSVLLFLAFCTALVVSFIISWLRNFKTFFKK